MRTWFWWMVGFAGLGLAIVGTVLPIMPTVPFLIVAVYGFNRSSPRFRDRLLNHPVFGPQIRDWQEHRAIAPRVKLLAVGSMAVGLSISFFILAFPWWLAQVAVLTLVSAYVLSRPAPPEH